MLHDTGYAAGLQGAVGLREGLVEISGVLPEAIEVVQGPDEKDFADCAVQAVGHLRQSESVEAATLRDRLTLCRFLPACIPGPA